MIFWDSALLAVKQNLPFEIGKIQKALEKPDFISNQ